jgi:hypothetical protein
MALGVRGLVSSMLVGSVDSEVMLVVVVVVSVVVAPSIKLIDKE